jgi:hypothetical protein
MTVFELIESLRRIPGKGQVMVDVGSGGPLVVQGIYPHPEGLVLIARGTVAGAEGLREYQEMRKDGPAIIPG